MRQVCVAVLACLTALLAVAPVTAQVRCGEGSTGPACYPAGNPSNGGGGGGAASPSPSPSPTVTSDPVVGADQPASIVVNRGQVRRTRPVRISGSGYTPGTRIRILIDGRQVSVVTVKADGTFSRVVRIPGYFDAGEHTITATGGGESGSTQLVVTVPTQPAALFEEMTGGTLTVGSLVAMFGAFLLASFGIRRYLGHRLD